MSHCIWCGKYIGFRGFCCKACHDEYYDSLAESLEKNKEYHKFCSDKH